MALFNYATRELSAKIVYYGPGLSGKTTNIEMVHKLLAPEQKGKLISLPTETDRTLFFDFLPLDLGQIKGFRVRFHLYTVPGQVFYNATRRLVLQGVDGVVFVADSQAGMEENNAESLHNLEENLATYAKRIEELPFIIQYNKRDLRNILTIEALESQLNPRTVPHYLAAAKDGTGVTETLIAVSRLVFANLRKTLLMPGDSDAHDEIGKIASAKMQASLTGGKVIAADAAGNEHVDEISELEDISVEMDEPVAKPASTRVQVTSLVDGVLEIDEDQELPEGVELLPMTPVREAGRPESDRLFDDIDQIEIDLPELGESVADDVVVAVAPEPVAPVASAEIAAPVEQVASPVTGAWLPAVDSAPEAAAGLDVDVEGAPGLTFLRFDEPSVAADGAAILPAVFLDAEGNRLRIRLKITVAGGR